MRCRCPVVFSELRTTTMSADDTVAAYTKALSDEGLQEFDTPKTQPIEDMAQGTYSDGADRTMVVIAFGPTAFDDPQLSSAKPDVPPNTTVVWLIAVDA